MKKVTHQGSVDIGEADIVAVLEQQEDSLDEPEIPSRGETADLTSTMRQPATEGDLALRKERSLRPCCLCDRLCGPMVRTTRLAMCRPRPRRRAPPW